MNDDTLKAALNAAHEQGLDPICDDKLSWKPKLSPTQQKVFDDAAAKGEVIVITGRRTGKTFNQAQMLARMKRDSEAP